MVISPDNTKVFVALGAGGTLIVDFDSTNFFSSASTHYHISTTQTSSGSYGSALSVAVDPNSKFFYIGETLGDSAGSSGGLLACEYADADNDKCTHASGSPFESGGISPLFILPDASGDYVYVANGNGDNKGNITGFAVTSSPISAISSVATAVQPLGLAEDSTDSYILEVGSKGSPYFASYTFDSTTPGKLDAAATSNVTADSVAIVAAPK
jgi:DNA-binding beta-propeller fold protein YncE